MDQLKFRIKKIRARLLAKIKKVPHNHDRLHVGCGKRFIENWLNIDIYRSDFDVDLGSGKLPWKSSTFKYIASQHVIEHLDLKTELIPLLKEIKRVSINNAEIWLSCPDMKKVCEAYINDKGAKLLKDRQGRHKGFRWSKNTPSQHIINEIFIQRGEHKNLFDFELLRWTLNEAGIKSAEEVSQKEFNNKFPEFPSREDDLQSIYVKATVAK